MKKETIGKQAFTTMKIRSYLDAGKIAPESEAKK